MSRHDPDGPVYDVACPHCKKKMDGWFPRVARQNIRELQRAGSADKKGRIRLTCEGCLKAFWVRIPKEISAPPLGET